MDNELFELCKDVYERTKWEQIYDTHDGSICVSSGCTHHAYYKDGQFQAHKYTSDYLAEKLPKTIKKSGIVYELELKYISGTWCASYCSYSSGFYDSLEPCGEDEILLKALLKLVKALHDAGELK